MWGDMAWAHLRDVMSSSPDINPAITEILSGDTMPPLATSRHTTKCVHDPQYRRWMQYSPRAI